MKDRRKIKRAQIIDNHKGRYSIFLHVGWMWIQLHDCLDAFPCTPNLIPPPKITVCICKFNLITLNYVTLYGNITTLSLISMSVPLTSCWASNQTKSVCFCQTKHNHMYEKHAGKQEKHTGAGVAFTARPLRQNNVLETKLHSVPLT